MRGRWAGGELALRQTCGVAAGDKGSHPRGGDRDESSTVNLATAPNLEPNHQGWASRHPFRLETGNNLDPHSSLPIFLLTNRSCDGLEINPRGPFSLTLGQNSEKPEKSTIYRPKTWEQATPLKTLTTHVAMYASNDPK